MTPRAKMNAVLERLGKLPLVYRTTPLIVALKLFAVLAESENDAVAIGAIIWEIEQNIICMEKKVKEFEAESGVAK